MWTAKYEAEETKGFQIVNFWRPIEMSAPLKHMPLAVCDPQSVPLEDIVTTTHRGLSEPGRPLTLMMLKRNAEHRWFYYPNMKNDEVLAFKSFELFKGVDDVEGAPLKTVFHTAFNDPKLPWYGNVEPRKSIEHRARIFFK